MEKLRNYNRAVLARMGQLHATLHPWNSRHLSGLEKVTRAHIDNMVSRKRMNFQFWVNYPFKAGYTQYNLTAICYMFGMHAHHNKPQQTSSLHFLSSLHCSTEPPLWKQGYNVTVTVLQTMSRDEVST